MDISAYKTAVALREYTENRKAIQRAKDILSGKMKPKGNRPDTVKAEQLNLICKDLTDAAMYEAKHDGGAVSDFLITGIAEMKNIARAASGTNEGKMLAARLCVLSCLLPTAEPMPPHIDGSLDFKQAVLGVVKKLPYSVRKKLPTVSLIELDKEKTLGLAVMPGYRVVGIVKGHTGKERENTIAHEFAHIWLNHDAHTPDAEDEAKAQAKAWGF